jgi:hypothetical protein
MDKKPLTRDELWFDSGKISERARILRSLQELKDVRCHSQTELTLHIIEDVIALINRSSE